MTMETLPFVSISMRETQGKKGLN